MPCASVQFGFDEEWPWRVSIDTPETSLWSSGLVLFRASWDLGFGRESSGLHSHISGAESEKLGVGDSEDLLGPEILKTSACLPQTVLKQ